MKIPKELAIQYYFKSLSIISKGIEWVIEVTPEVKLDILESGARHIK
ncbi:hypothetical protein [Bacillus thuringiensis]|nr:hypothetical protein [Bacillus thuringiensis]